MTGTGKPIREEIIESAVNQLLREELVWVFILDNRTQL